MLHAARGGEWRTARVSDPLGRPVTARWLALPDGSAVVDSAEAVGLPLVGVQRARPAARARRAGSESCCSRSSPSSRASCSSASAARRPSTAAPACATVVGSALRDARVRVAVRRAQPAARRTRRRARLRSAEGRRPARRSRSSNGASRRSPSSSRTATCRAPARAAASARRFAALGAELCDGAALVLDTIGFDERARRADLVVTGEGAVDRDDARRKGARCGRSPVRRSSACACVLFGGVVRDGIDARPLSGDVGRAAEDLEELGEELGSGAPRARVAPRSFPARPRASSRRCGRALRRAPRASSARRRPRRRARGASRSPRARAAPLRTSAQPTVAPNVPSATRTSIASPRSTCVEERTSSSPRWTIA